MEAGQTKPPNYTKRRIIAAGIAIVAVFVVAGGIAEMQGGQSAESNVAAPATSSPPDPQQALKDLDRSIARADYTGVNLNLETNLGNLGDDAAFRTGETIIRLGKALQAGLAGPTAETKFVFVIVRGPTLDRLGREGVDKFMQMRFSIADLRAANYANLTTYDVLNLADQISISRVAQPDVIDMCKSRGQYADRFCRAALADML